MSRHLDTEGPLQHHWLFLNFLSQSVVSSQTFPLKDSTLAVSHTLSIEFTRQVKQWKCSMYLFLFISLFILLYLFGLGLLFFFFF